MTDDIVDEIYHDCLSNITLFNAFSHRIVCLDSTHKTNHYRFKLLILVVRDEFHNGRLNAVAIQYAYASVVYCRCASCMGNI